MHVEQEKKRLDMSIKQIRMVERIVSNINKLSPRKITGICMLFKEKNEWSY